MKLLLEMEHVYFVEQKDGQNGKEECGVLCLYQDEISGQRWLKFHRQKNVNRKKKLDKSMYAEGVGRIALSVGTVAFVIGKEMLLETLSGGKRTAGQGALAARSAEKFRKEQWDKGVQLLREARGVMPKEWERALAKLTSAELFSVNLEEVYWSVTSASDGYDMLQISPKSCNDTEQYSGFFLLNYPSKSAARAEKWKKALDIR